MTSRTLLERLASPAGFAVALLLFLLPFLTVSCEASSDSTPVRVDATFTGIDLLVGGSPDLSAVGGQGSPTEADPDIVAQVDAEYGQYYPPQPLVLAAAALLLGGLIAALVLPAALRTWPSVVAAAGAAALLAVELLVVAPARFTSAMRAQIAPDDFSAASFATLPGVGFFLCTLILVALAVWQAWQAVRRPNRDVEPGHDEFWPDSPAPPA